MPYQTKQISRHRFFLTGVKIAAGILAANRLPSCSPTKTSSAYNNNKPTDYIEMTTCYRHNATSPPGLENRLSSPDRPFPASPSTAMIMSGFLSVRTAGSGICSDGKLICAWGENLVKTSHFLKIDRRKTNWL